ncbi:MAG: LCCL domain-containing protein [Phaeovulum sp.]|uniref:LCCL domain-containing protein n=1 Tax=Phaeovulum sp. TaxID=2934796 RepID=UPI002731A029|nr:LCCL domain-containing protein [Phaeovulum sp.]MDP2064282.1 LCCL domain-containing protein [Phaeovulum sp.]
MFARITLTTHRIPAMLAGALVLILGVFASAQMAAAQALPECNYSYPSGQTEYSCFCPPGRGDGSIWGTGLYTSDSDLCTAAKHAGMIGKAGGNIRAVVQPGQANYPSTAQNGITSSEWGSYSESIEFYLPGQAVIARLPGCDYYFPSDKVEYACSCAPGDFDGAVWGSGTYTSDSDLCTAARHAGVIGAGGGDIFAVARPGLEKYPSTTQNGITSSDWGSYSSSIEFVVNLAVEPVPVPLASGPVCGKFPVGATTHDCVCAATGAAAVGPVWGSNPYVTDSDICEAARHAGVIGAAGGAVRLFGLPGLAAYAGSARNGVTSYDWAAYGASFSFDGNLR